MKFLNSLQNIIVKFDRKEFYRYAGVYFGVVFLIAAGLVYLYVSRLSSLRSDLKKLNIRRSEVQLLLKKLKDVKQQSAEVNEVLAEEKSFKIQSFFDGIVTQQNLTSKQKRDAEVSEELLYKRYTEIKLSAQFRQLDMMALCKLLSEIEQKTRIYIKELSISKTKGAGFDAALTIATLKPQSDTTKT